MADSPNANTRLPAPRLNVIAVLIAVAVIAGGVIGWQNIKRHIFPRHWEVVDQGMVYRSGELSSTLVKSTWEKHNIKTVVNLIGKDEQDDPAHEAAATAATELGINRAFFPLIGDGTGAVESYVGAVKAIVESKSQNNPVVVHCAAGTYRTGGVVAAYRTLVEGWTGKAAYEEMISEGVKPGPATPLVVYLNAHIGEIAQRLVEEGVIEKVPDPLPVFGP